MPGQPPSSPPVPHPLFSWVVTVLVLAGLGFGGLTWAFGAGSRPADGDPVAPGPVVLVGVPGLSWDDIDADTMPWLAGEAETGAVGALVVRSAPRFTCPDDGWLTISAGQRAIAAGPDTDREGCSQPDAPRPDDDGTWAIPAWSDWQAAAADRLMGAELGSLARGVPGCITAHDSPAAFGAASPEGLAQLAPDDWIDSECEVHLITMGAVTDDATARAVDSALGELASEVPPEWTLIVAGISDRLDGSTRSGLRAVLLPGAETGTLTSASTRQPGLIQLADLTVTLTEMAGGTPPDAVIGQQVRVLPDDGGLRTVRDIAAGGTTSTLLVGPVLGILGLLLAAGLVVALRAGRSRQAAVVATVTMAVPAATFLACLVPWWRPAGTAGGFWTLLVSGTMLALAVAFFAVLIAALARVGGHRQGPFGPPMLVAAATLLVVGLDVIWGGRLGLLAPLGVLPTSGGRFYGVGNVAAGILLGALMVLVAGVAAGLHRRAHPWAVAGAIAALGLVVAVVDGAPQWGADFGGVPALVIATGLVAMAAAGLRLTAARLGLLALAAALVAAALMLLDWRRPPSERTHLGAFVQDVIDGQGLAIVTRKAEQSLNILVSYPVSWLGVLALLLLAWGVLMPASAPGRLLEPLFALPLTSVTAVALLAGLVIGWAANDSGIALLGLGLAVGGAGLLAVRLELGEGPRRPGGPAPTTRRGTAGPGAAAPADPAR